jgi:hypothetical protein
MEYSSLKPEGPYFRPKLKFRFRNFLKDRFRLQRKFTQKEKYKQKGQQHLKKKNYLKQKKYFKHLQHRRVLKIIGRYLEKKNNNVTMIKKQKYLSLILNLQKRVRLRSRSIPT